MMNIFYIQRLLFLCVSVLHSAGFHNISKGDFTFTGESPYVMACQQWVGANCALLLDQTEKYCSGKVSDERGLPAGNVGGVAGDGCPEVREFFLQGVLRVVPAGNVGGVAGDGWMQYRSNPAEGNEPWQRFVEPLVLPSQPLDAQKSGDDIVSPTCYPPNIESDSTSSHSQLKKSEHTNADKIGEACPKKKYRYYADAQKRFRSNEIKLRLNNDVAAILRYQILLRQTRARVKKKIAAPILESNSCMINSFPAKMTSLDKDIEELIILEKRETADLSKEQRLINLEAQLQDSLSQATDGQGMVVWAEAQPKRRGGKVAQKTSNPATGFVEMEELRKLTNYEATLDQGVLKAVPKSVKLRVTDGQDMEYSHPLAGSVSGDATSDAKRSSKIADIAIKRAISRFLLRGKKRPSNHQQLLQDSQDKKEQEGENYKVRNDKSYAKLASFKHVRRGIILSLVQDQWTLAQIKDCLQSMQQEDAEAKHLLNALSGIEFDLQHSDTTVEAMALAEHDKKVNRARKRAALAGAVLDQEGTTPQNKRFMTIPSQK